MNRRLFLRAASLASAVVVFGKELLARPSTVPVPSAHPFVDDSLINIRGRRERLQVAQEVRPVFKVTGLLTHIGQESAPYSVTANEDGYLTLPDLGNVDQYALYAPMPGFEQSGPWYLTRTISRREARRARFTIVAPTNYRTSDLFPQLCPRERLSFTLPPPAEGQTDWRIYGGDLNGPASVLIDVL